MSVFVDWSCWLLRFGIFKCGHFDAKNISDNWRLPSMFIQSLNSSAYITIRPKNIHLKPTLMTFLDGLKSLFSKIVSSYQAEMISAGWVLAGWTKHCTLNATNLLDCYDFSNFKTRQRQEKLSSSNKTYLKPCFLTYEKEAPKTVMMSFTIFLEKKT